MTPFGLGLGRFLAMRRDYKTVVELTATGEGTLDPDTESDVTRGV